MRVSPLSALLVVACLAVAGCGGKSAKEDIPDADFSDVDVRVTEKTGAIRGLVVDERIQPVASAIVSLSGGVQKNQTTDDLGRFAFSELAPGTYFLTVKGPFHAEAQTSAEVRAGDAEPPLVKVQVARLFDRDPYTSSLKHDGFFECSQAGASPFFSSSNCVSDVTRSSRWPGPKGMVPQLNNVTNQARQWQSGVDADWQTLIWEIAWEATSDGTSEKLGITVSTDFATRDTTFFYASYDSMAPLLLRLETGVEHETSQSTDDANPPVIPPEGRPDISYFVSVREPDGSTCAALCAPPGVALNQAFTVYYTQFYIAPAPEGWSLVAGDLVPF